METPKEIIRWLYLNPKSPVCFSNANYILKEARKKYPKLKLGFVEDVLQRIPSYTLHRKRRVKFKRLKTIPIGFMSDIQMDLADFQKVADDNDGYKYMLVCTDVLSKRIFASPVKSKGSDHMIQALKHSIRQMPVVPRRIFSDKGLEFQAKDVKKFLKDLTIKQMQAESPDVKASVAERCIRTIKTRLYKYFTENKTKRWVDVLPDLIKALNHSINRSTGLRPIDIDFTNEKIVHKKLYGAYLTQLHRQRDINLYEPDDMVRIAKEKTTFEKSYLPNYTDEVFRISKKRLGNPTTYQVKDSTNKPLTGKFYKEELSRTKTSKDSKYIVDRILKTRVRKGGLKEMYVAFRNKPLKEAAWITENDLV